MRVFKKNIDRESFSILKSMPCNIEIHQGSSATAYFTNGKKCTIGCLSCQNPRCIFFDETDIDCNNINDFPFDKSLNACPVDALKWDESLLHPVIDDKKCIHCGICVSRCPVGALYFSNNGKLMINIEKGKCVNNIEATADAKIHHLNQISTLLSVPRTGVALSASDNLFEVIYDKLFKIKNNQQNIIVRNLFVALGCRCSMRRVGDVYTRMDAVYSSLGGSFGAVEIEFGKDTLDAARGILDDIAVLNTRYGISKEMNNAIVVCLQLPNARQGYWQVVRDIKIVEGIKIGTITIGALMLLLWNGCVFEPEDAKYYIDYDNMNLRQIICTQIKSEDILLNDKTLGIVEPMK